MTVSLEAGALVPAPTGRGTPIFTNVNMYSSGPHLDFNCHRLRGPYSSTSGCSFGLFLFAHHFTGAHDFGSER